MSKTIIKLDIYITFSCTHAGYMPVISMLLYRVYLIIIIIIIMCIYYYYVFILSAISPYTTGLKALFNQSDCTGTAPTHK